MWLKVFWLNSQIGWIWPINAHLIESRIILISDYKMGSANMKWADQILRLCLEQLLCITEQWDQHWYKNSCDFASYKIVLIAAI